MWTVATDGLGISSATEAAISATQAANTAAGSASLLGITHMGNDLDSHGFAAALRLAGAAYLASAAEQVAQRAGFAGGQSLASTTYVATEAVREASLLI